jgi:hypothetical protein
MYFNLSVMLINIRIDANVFRKKEKEMAENYSDGLLDDFQGVEDFEGSIDDLEKLDDVKPTEETQEVQETQDALDEQINYDNLSTEELEKMLEEPNDTKVEETTESHNEEVHTNLKIALSESREKSNLLKEQNELVKQQMELLKEELEALKVNSPNPVDTPQVTTDVSSILDEIDDESVVSGAELKKVIELQKQQATQLQNQTNVQQIQNRVAQMEKDFNATHGDELGDMSYKNVYNLYKTGEVKLTAGQELDIQNAFNDGKNPVEVFYETVVNSTPKLKEKMFIKRLIEQRKSASGTEEPVVQQNAQVEDDFSRIDNAPKNMSSHLDKLSEF